MMRSMRLLASCVVAAAAVFAAGCNKPADSTATTGGPGASGGGGGSGIKIAVIPKGTTHSYWKSVEAGARKAGQDLGVEILYKGPLLENDRAQQIGVVQNFTSDKVSAIVLAPLDDAALKQPVDAAMEQKIPVVIIDSALKGDVGKDFVSFVATNNKQGGEMGGQQLAKLLGGKGKVVLLRYMEGSASTADREAGFLDAIGKHPDIQILVQNRYGGATESEAQTASMNMLDQIRQADGIFCPNESSTAGMLKALRQAQLAGKVKFVGFDASPTLVDALKNSEIDALVSQDPVKMGYEGVATAVKAVKGQPFDTNIDTGVKLITRDNLNDPDVQQLTGQQAKK